MKKKRFSKLDLYVLLLIAVFVAYGIFILNNISLLNSFNTTGQIGDTIAGVTAPAMGLLNVILLFLALREQRKSNEQFKQQFIQQAATGRLIENLKILREDINNFVFIHREIIDVGKAVESEWKGADAIKHALEKYTCLHITPTPPEVENQHILPCLIQIQWFLEEIYYLMGDIKSDVILEEDQSHLMRILQNIYYSKFRIYLAINQDRRKKKQKPCRVCGDTHGLPEQVYELYDLINAKIDNKCKKVKIHATLRTS